MQHQDGANGQAPVSKRNGSVAPATAIPTLDVGAQLEGARLLVLGGTGFLGKIFWVLLLDRYPQIGKIFLLVRKSAKHTSEERFWRDVATSEAMDPLRKKLGDGLNAFLKEKIVPIDGDVGLPHCGIETKELKGTIDAVINVAGVVDFNPPLDEALDTNAFGAQNLVALARALGDAPLMHTSTCYVVGNREGLILEEKPGERYPFPRADELGRDLWNPEREIADCLDLIAQAKSRCEDAFRQSDFLERATKNLKRRGEPTIGEPLEEELRSVKRKYVSDRLVEAGLERATHWGWPNIYTYTKSIGEQIIARSGIPYTIARPACCESTIRFPFPGWNEGIGTSAPIIFLSMKGHHQIVGRDVILDFIPADVVCAGMILTLAELLEGTAKPVYQYGASDVNPGTSERFGELIALYKRKYFQRRGKGNPFLNFLQQHMEPAIVSQERFDAIGPGAMARAARTAAKMFKKAPGPIGKPVASTLESMARQEEKIDHIIRLFQPFTWDQKGPFSCANVHAAYARVSPEDREKLDWTPAQIDWADYWMNQHMPAMEKRVIPWMEERYKKELKPLKAHDTLATLVDQMAERHEHALAFGRMEEDGIARQTFLDVQARSNATAARLAALGVKKGDRVVLSGHNHPDWPIAFFGIVRAGGTAVPIDPALDAAQFANVVHESEAKIVLWDPKVEETCGGSLDASLSKHHLADITAADPSLAKPDVVALDDDVASLIYTSGTTGKPKGVMLTHANFTSLVAALAPLFPLGTGDRVLSVLPLHHTFEFTCGMLLPFSRGSRVVYLDELKGDRVSTALKEARVTAMVGVPAVWQLLERRILSQVQAKGPIVEKAFEIAADLNRQLSKGTGIDLGKILFGPVHEGLGGNIRYLISGGAALPKDTQKLFAGLGFKLTEGYGLTEAAPVLTVAKPGSPAGQVGKPIPGVTIKIDSPDDNGVGEVLARGPNVMAGYTDPEATKAVKSEDGWLHTGDLGKLDRDGRLVLVGRVKDVIVTSTGENVYPDDIERMLGKIPHISELAIVGVTGRSGGERVGCIAVPEEDESLDRAARNERAQNALRGAIGKLPYGRQPTIIHLYDAPLPKTATRKVKRNEARALLERLMHATARHDGGEAPTSPVRVALAAVKGKKASEIHGDMTIGDDLGFDSLALTELLVALEAKYGTIEPKALQACRTVADVENLVGTERASLRPQAMTKSRYAIEGREEEQPAGSKKPIVLPSPVQDQGKKLIGKLQDLFYDNVMRSNVVGRAFIPHNRNTIVVANHVSHLDMGFVRHALGKYGEDITTLAAQDYFFEKNTLQRAFFENLTNLKAVDRRGGLRASERQAGEILTRGKTMLIFPEGTRSTDGELHEFKPLLGHLALTYSVDILPLYLAGTREAMPKGGKIPMSREIEARIGPPITVTDMRRLTKGLSAGDASREVAKLAHRAVLALKTGTILDVSRLATLEEEGGPKEHPLVTLFAELEGKFQKDAVDKPVSFYFTLGSDEKAKWTVVVSKEACEVKLGKPAGGTADCVLKTSAEIFTKIVRDAYTPGPSEFLSGAIKSNDVGLLMTFQKVFALA